MERERKGLGKYHSKRAPGVTNEPFGGEAPSRPAADAEASPTVDAAFVIHLHDATRRHYDVRLEVGGVLLSFAVPRGPSLDPAEKVLAVKTEDHPIEYLEFEDVIPPEQYGAGPMIVWDRGSLSWLEGPPEDELRAGKLHVELRGTKVRGRWAFVKLAKGETGNEWLFFKKQDAHADASRSLTEELPRSILSGLTVEELGERDVIGRALVEHARSIGGRRAGELVAALATQPSSPLVEIDAKRTGAKASRTPSLYDPELDGIRILAVRDGDVVTLRRWPSGEVEAIEAFYPDVVRALRALPVPRLALDGELVAFDLSGRPSRERLATRAARVAEGEAFRAVTSTPVVFVVTDVLAIGDADVRPLAIEARRELLARLLPASGVLRAPEPLDGDERRIVATCVSLGIPNVIAKPKGSVYGAKSGWRRLTTGAVDAPAALVAHVAHGPRARVAERSVVVSNREKVFWPNESDAPMGAYTKGELIDYYASIADVLLPYLADRPVILVRYPDGIHGKSFYQWNVPVGMPPWVRTLAMHDVEDYLATPSGPPSSRAPLSIRPPNSERTPKRGFLVDERSTLIYIANLGCIPLHVLASRAPDLTRSDFLTIDFDVKQSSLRHAITLAQTLRGILDAIGLPGFPKTSGQSGLHVLVPLGGDQSFDTARAMADLLGRLLVDRHPDIATMERIVNKRGPKVYVDTGQTGITRAIVAPYSVRAVPGATVSTPLTWDEVTPDLDPRAFTIATVPSRVRHRGDLLAGLLGGRPDVAGAVARLANQLQTSR